MNENKVNSRELDVYTKIIVNNNTKNNALIFFPVIDLCRVNENYYKIIIIKIFKISQFHIFTVNGKVDTEKMK